jgi:hypothetical protein
MTNRSSWPRGNVIKMAGKLMRSPGPVEKKRVGGNALAKMVSAERKAETSVEPPENATRGWDLGLLRNKVRPISAVVLLAFVVCHLTAHSFLLVSFERAGAALDILMYPWRSVIGTAVLASALLAHYSNALWSIYVRRHLRLSRWEWWQLSLGLSIPLLLMFHVIGTRVAEGLLGVTSRYSSVLLVQWQLSPWLGVLQVTGVLTVWIHACIGIHFWLRTKTWYAGWRPLFVGVGLLLPTLALAGYVTAGNQVLRATENPNYAKLSLQASNLTDQKRTEIGRIARVGSAIYLASDIAALCRPRRARLGLSPPPASSVDSFERPNGTHATGSDGTRDIARERHSPCLSLWGTSALHNVPDPGDKGAAQSARTVGIGGESVGPYRSDVRRAAGLSDWSDRRHLCHAAPGCRCQSGRRYGPRGARGKRAIDHGDVR